MPRRDDRGPDMGPAFDTAPPDPPMPFPPEGIDPATQAPTEDEQKKAIPRRRVEARKDETVPGGRYIRGGFLAEDGQHYGGQVVDANGKVLASFEDHQVNTG